MPPKSKKASAGEKAKDLQETEDPLQAVVLADSFETRFNPFTKEKPRCLLPLANTPLIEYTLEFLANSGVEEVYLYCGAHTDQVEAYIHDSKWTQASSPFSLQTIRSTSRSIGDAMRDLDKRGILANDFVVVYGDVVSNISIEAALNEHRARRATDKNAIMTMILREGSKDTHKRTTVSPIFTMDPSRKRCLQYDQIAVQGGKGPHALMIDEDVLLQSGAEEIDVRHDLIDCGIDICTPDVLALWSDNFDYEAPRRGFLHSVLKDYELNGKTIHAFVEQQGYGNRVRDLQSYDRISKDVLGRWTWPMSPDGTFGEDYGCRMHKGGAFREDGVKLSKSAVVGKRTVLGAGAIIGARSVIEGSVIGRGCTIGADCTIQGSYLWDNVKVHDGTQIRTSIVASDATVGKKCNIQEGSLVSYGVVVADETTTRQRQSLIQGANSAPQISDHGLSADSDSDTEGSNGLIPLSLTRTASASSISTLSSSRSASPSPLHRTVSGTSNTSDPSTTGTSAESSFHTEAVASVYDSLLRGDDPANINLELQAQRLALNASEHAVRKAVVCALVSYVMHVREAQKTGQAQGKVSSVRDILKDNGDLVRRVVFDLDEEEKTDQVDLLLLAQRELAGKQESEVVMLSLCNGLYAEDLVQGEALVQWWEDDRGTESETLKAVRSHKQMEQMIDIAREEDESDDEDDEDDDEDEDD